MHTDAQDPAILFRKESSMEYQECLEQLKKNTIYTNQAALSVRIKPIPDDPREGVPDPRVLKRARQTKPAPVPRDGKHPAMEELQAIRDWMGCENVDLSHQVTTEKRILQTDSGNVPVSVYQSGGGTQKPLVIYIHGGAFFGGSAKVVENACRLLAERSGAVVLSVDYALAPEARFPKGLNQCWQTVRWAYKHAGELQADPNRLAVMGDSAGGNLAAGCSMLDQNSIIRLQILLYPCTLMDLTRENWDESRYFINPESGQHTREALKALIYETRGSFDTMKAAYLDDPKEALNPLASPLLAEDLSGMPPTLIMAAEYDYLTQQAEEFAKRLTEAGVDTHFYLYRGMGHAFFEHTGEFPQAEDCTDEAAKAIRAIR